MPPRSLASSLDSDLAVLWRGNALLVLMGEGFSGEDCLLEGDGVPVGGWLSLGSKPRREISLICCTVLCITANLRSGRSSVHRPGYLWRSGGGCACLQRGTTHFDRIAFCIVSVLKILFQISGQISSRRNLLGHLSPV